MVSGWFIAGSELAFPPTQIGCPRHSRVRLVFQGWNLGVPFTGVTGFPPFKGCNVLFKILTKSNQWPVSKKPGGLGGRPFIRTS